MLQHAALIYAPIDACRCYMCMGYVLCRALLFLIHLQPLVSKVELEQTKALAAEFGRPGGVGEKLQKLLEKRAEEKDNWVYMYCIIIIYCIAGNFGEGSNLKNLVNTMAMITKLNYRQHAYGTKYSDHQI